MEGAEMGDGGGVKKSSSKIICCVGCEKLSWLHSGQGSISGGWERCDVLCVQYTRAHTNHTLTLHGIVLCV